MPIQKNPVCCLTGNALKIIAALSMLIDHVGYILFPHIEILRIIGRIAFPIFAFMISEGCVHTKNKVKYFLGLAALAAVCQGVYYVAEKSLYMSAIVTFSLSVLVIYAMQNMKTLLFCKTASAMKKLCATILFAASVAGVYVLNIYFVIDYGFWGCMMPVFAGILRYTNGMPDCLKKADNNAVHVLMMGIATALLAVQFQGIQMYSMIALVPLMLYNGKRGRYKMKWFFYVFYPAHLAVLAGIAMMINF